MLSREADAAVPGGILADEMGLGKTVVTVALSLARPVRHTLVVVPGSLVDQWREHFMRFAGVVPAVARCPAARNFAFADDDGRPRVLITTYSAFSKRDRGAALYGVRFDRAIFDEAHLLKNRRSQVHANVLDLDLGAVWLLTGTPVCRAASDFKGLLRVLRASPVRSRCELRAAGERFVLRQIGRAHV